MDKAPDAFRTISEVAEELDIPQHVLRFWETRFAQIKPMKRSGGRRYYRPDDVDLLKGIRRLLYGEGYTIRGVQRILKEHGIKSVQGLADQTSAVTFGAVEEAIGLSLQEPEERRDADRRCPRTRTRMRTRPKRRKSTTALSIPTTTAFCCRSSRPSPGPRTPTANAWNGCCRISVACRQLLDNAHEGRLTVEELDQIVFETEQRDRRWTHNQSATVLEISVGDREDLSLWFCGANDDPV